MLCFGPMNTYLRRSVQAILIMSAAMTTTHLAAQNPGGGPPPQNQPGPPAGPPVDGALEGFGVALAGLDATSTRAFEDGLAEFIRLEEVAGGLGPVFNDRSCAACHNQGGIGGGSGRTVTRFGRIADGRFDPLTALGGSLIQERGIGRTAGRRGDTDAFQGESVPAEATVVARRRTTPLFGLGLVDAVPDSAIESLASAQATGADGVRGRVNYVVDAESGRVMAGRFGWKAQSPTLLHFSGDAYLNEMGITSPRFPDEVCPQGDCAALQFNPVPSLNDDGRGVQAAATFMRLLAAPPRGTITPQVRTGEAVFTSAGCAACHVPTLRTGPSATPALNQKVLAPYSDFLLHDMGSLGDGIVQAGASGQEMRTAPLWGLRAVRRYLHDGTATTLEQAIERHEGEGSRARDRFTQLDRADRAALLAFLNSL